MATAIPFGWTVQNAAGAAVNGAKIYFYVPGTVTPRSPYTDAALTVPSANPVIADSAGWFLVYLSSELGYDIVVKSGDDSITYQERREASNISGAQPVDATLTAIAGLAITSGDYIEGTGTDTFRARKLQVATYAALTAIEAASRFDDMVVYVASRATDGDGGEGWWRFDAASSATANGGTILAPDAGTGRWLRVYSGAVNVRWFGATGDGVTNDALAFLAAIALLEADVTTTGGEIYIPAGHYIINSGLVFTARSQIHGIYLKGDGEGATILDFAGCSAGTDGIKFGDGAHFGIEDIRILSAPRDNISIGPATGSNFARNFSIKNVRSQAAGRHNFWSRNSFLGTIDMLWSKDSVSEGVVFAGFHTAIQMRGCESDGSGASGYSLNGMVYCSFDACGADDNGTFGWAGSNLQGVTFTSCGAESNARDAFKLFTSDASASGLPTTAQNLRGVELVGCYAVLNSTASAGTYASFLSISTENSRSAEVSIRGGSAHPNAAGDRALILAGTSGSIALTTDNFDDSSFSTADTVSGTVERQNREMIGRSCLLQKTSTQSFTDSALADITWSTTALVNTLGASVSSTGITIPRGVNRVRVSVSSAWDSSDVGFRFTHILKNGSGARGLPTARMLATGASQNCINSAVIEVSEGDVFTAQGLQTSGGALNMVANSAVWFSVEAVG